MPTWLGSRLALALAPPAYLAPPAAGVDISASGVKAVRLAPSPYGPILASYHAEYLSQGAFADGEFADSRAIAEALARAAGAVGIESASAALPEAKAYLFETSVPGASREEWRTAVEQKLDELIPLPPADARFDIVPVGESATLTRVAGVGYARRIVDLALAVYDAAGVTARSLESETFAAARALILQGDRSTVLVIDVGKTTTKLAIIEARIPRFATTIGIGGHAFTVAIQKHFGVTEQEARRVKIEHGIVPAPGNEDYLAAMLSTASAIRDEIGARLEYWQSRQAKEPGHAPVARAILAGGNASVRGLPEFLEGALGIPVALGDVFTNLAPRDYWIPELDYAESLAYATAIGLALHDPTPYDLC